VIVRPAGRSRGGPRPSRREFVAIGLGWAPVLAPEARVARGSAIPHRAIRNIQPALPGDPWERGNRARGGDGAYAGAPRHRLRDRGKYAKRSGQRRHYRSESDVLAGRRGSQPEAAESAVDSGTDSLGPRRTRPRPRTAGEGANPAPGWGDHRAS